MQTVGKWELVKTTVEKWGGNANTVPTEKSVSRTETVDSHRNLWRHSDGKTYLKVFQNSQGRYDAVVYMGRPDSVSVGPGWTCGVDCRHTDAETAVEWAYDYVTENSDVSHLYDD